MNVDALVDAIEGIDIFGMDGLEAREAIVAFIRSSAEPPCPRCGSCVPRDGVCALYGASAEPPLAPQTAWRCFQCDEVFTDKAEAQEHFGDYPDDSPLCLIKGADGGFAKRIRELEAEVAENAYENDARLWHEAEAERRRLIGNRQWHQELDYREGEKLALQEQLAKASSPARSTPPPPSDQGEAKD